MCLVVLDVLFVVGVAVVVDCCLPFLMFVVCCGLRLLLDGVCCCVLEVLSVVCCSILWYSGCCSLWFVVARNCLLVLFVFAVAGVLLVVAADW